MGIRDELITPEMARELRERNDRYEAWSAQFTKPNGWTVITAEEMKSCPADAVISNEERGKLEQFEVWRDKPEKLVAYYKLSGHYGATVTTWTGDILGYGEVTRTWRSNSGDRRMSITVTIAGETYSGTAYLDSGNYCRLRKLKGGKH